MIVQEITFQQWFAESPARLFERFHQHERLAEIYPASFRRVRDGDGEDPDGAGSIREIRGPGLVFREQITECRVPAFIEYRIVSGVPLISHHLGQMWFRPAAGGTTLDYRMELSFRLPGNRFWALIMKRLVQQRLRRLAKRINSEESS